MKSKHRGFMATVALVLALTVTVFLGGCGGGGGSDQAAQDQQGEQVKEITIKLAHESPATHAKGVWAENFKKVVEEKSGGKIKVDLYHQGQLYSSPKAALEAVRNGVIQMSIASTGYMSGVVPEFEVFDLPMLFPNSETFYKFQDGEIGRELLQKVEAKGYKGLGYISNVPLDAFTKEPLVEISDFNGKNLRVHSAALELSVKALGGNPISMAASEVYMAMEQGMVDGLFTTVTYAAPNKFYEVAPHMTKARISAIAYPVVMGLNFWNGLSEQQQQIIRESVDEAIQMNRDELAKLEEKSIKILTEGGIQVHELTPEQRQAWVDKLSVVYDEISERVGKDIIERTQEFVTNNS